MPEQQRILSNTARVLVVRAAPGSGKTWLVAELIRRKLDDWAKPGCGIAALSFTRVGGDEIRRAMGHELAHPHFVGTIDAFLFRFVIRPFLRRCYPQFAEPRLIPGEWGAEHWRTYGPKLDTVVGKGVNLFKCVFIDEQRGNAVVAHNPYPGLPLQRLTGDDLEKVVRGKRQCWQTSGCLTHSDAALWASKVLEHQLYGATIRGEIIRRFPLLIVDELQDTGYFLGKSIRLLLKEPEARGVLVGDPDQAIFEFTGARPDLFDDFEAIEGAVSLPLSKSRRCPAAVTKVISHIKDSHGEIRPAPDRHGKAVLLKCSHMKADVERVVRAIARTHSARNVKVIARSNQTIEDLIGRRSGSPPRLHCPALYHIHRAVIAFRQEHRIAALAGARSAIDVSVFGHEGVGDERLRRAKIDPGAWKSLAVRCLLSANELPVTGSVFDWQKAAGDILDAELKAFGLDPNLEVSHDKLGPQRRGDYDKPSADYLPQAAKAVSSLTGVPIQTVHGVKGETHDITIFVCPKTNTANCPSVVWWSPTDKHREERRIAYVAMSRTRGDLIVCVSEDNFQRLCLSRPQFTSSFECMTIDEFDS